MSTANVPAYWLYGERRGDRFPDALHIETINARSAINNWRIQPHRHQDMHQFFLIVAGGGRARIDGVDHRLAPGTAMLITPFVIHEFWFEAGTIGYVASVAEVILRRLFEREPMTMQTLAGPRVLDQPLDRPEVQELLAAMQAALAEFGRNAGGREIALSAHAALLATWFARAASQVSRSLEPSADGRIALVQRFVARVEADFRSHQPLDAYARQLGVSVPHLTRCCRETLGHPAIRIIHDRLMIEARRYLVYTSMSISQIAFGLGFSDPAYFSRFFAARAGLSPSDYRAAG
ncbi:helix-turn-helix domain-containing protein [Kaistia dalseonensis]|uniref:AraC family transcriptional activator of pobA n=1 Tax=Kaistia dalseonensis TaxID=410840 RepID=A0ABU0HB01_9HYPH|nr:helix-turn-helix domain-containing protein [Kaistia dalseonensis]MCX5496052.1 helix-turn-helix domain-containing protein [Kaistia dalseonensis]MDQ0438656.1 AraC family transcriptional activator of pobA [Kaistia dalseonensis]